MGGTDELHQLLISRLGCGLFPFLSRLFDMESCATLALLSSPASKQLHQGHLTVALSRRMRSGAPIRTTPLYGVSAYHDRHRPPRSER